MIELMFNVYIGPLNLCDIVRWQKVLNPNLVKGPWTKEEDESLL